METKLTRARSSVFAILLLGCSADDGAQGVATATSPADDSGAAIALTKTCIQREGYRTVWGTAPTFDKVRASHMHDRVWVVDVPETGFDDAGKPVMTGRPSGLGVIVDLDRKSCRQMALE